MIKMVNGVDGVIVLRISPPGAGGIMTLLIIILSGLKNIRPYASAKDIFWHRLNIYNALLSSY